MRLFGKDISAYFEELIIKNRTENGQPIVLNSDLAMLLNILEKADARLETGLKSELKRILSVQPSIFPGIPNIPKAFIDGFKIWSTFYYNIDGLLKIKKVR